MHANYKALYPESIGMQIPGSGGTLATTGKPIITVVWILSGIFIVYKIGVLHGIYFIAGIAIDNFIHGYLRAALGSISIMLSRILGIFAGGIAIITGVVLYLTTK